MSEGPPANPTDIDVSNLPPTSLRPGQVEPMSQHQSPNPAEVYDDEGRSGYLEVPDAERSPFAASAASGQVDNLVRLYVSLGGGGLEER